MENDGISGDDRAQIRHDYEPRSSNLDDWAYMFILSFYYKKFLKYIYRHWVSKNLVKVVN